MAIQHNFDLTVEDGDGIEVVKHTAFFAAQSEERVDDGGFDCAGTVGSAGTIGGTLGTAGTFGCCC